jgi:hypothetical protein
MSAFPQVIPATEKNGEYQTQSEKEGTQIK